MVMYNTSLAMGNRLPAAHSIQTEMDNNFICVGASLSVEAVIAILRSSSLTDKRLNLIFISGDAGEYLGFVYLSKVVVSQMNIIMKDIMHKSDIAISALMDKVQARKLLLDSHLPMIPIIDSRNRVIGAYSI
ncbi:MULTISPECIES: hypothetical protein [Vibrio]|uniref:hypothetical protein n=1 Tax=Vibrio TaxID=662 RepID=UPI0002E89F40|nr:MULTISPECIES: hypothetical protein [Vibrio]ATC56476.1 hypothetical protein CMV05_01570 [Vibrio anguillarum]MBF4249770.1 hypothetical protein [Vibrio anguillarum]MBF4389038.1 hypothetical protein [Vibrio anguillarum]MBF4403320.1 hypothetical protein [Vibrio anguillarum]MDF9390228.1 hypothetical protein [Vibrio sp. 1151_11]